MALSALIYKTLPEAQNRSILLRRIQHWCSRNNVERNCIRVPLARLHRGHFAGSTIT